LSVLIGTTDKPLCSVFSSHVRKRRKRPADTVLI